MVTPDLNNTSSWQYHLPDELIASRPTERRDQSRLMLVNRHSGQIQHCQVCDLPDILQDNSRLVFNNTKVVPARLFGYRTSTKGKWEGLFLSVQPDGKWIITGKTRGRLAAGESLTIFPAGKTSDEIPEPDVLELILEEKLEQGSWIVSVADQRHAFQILDQYGTLPLPPYIGRDVADESDAERYQTVFADVPGAIAAPTAGLHFSKELLGRCQQQSITTSEVTLHVGIGTFRPVSTDNLADHHMHSEWCRVSEQSASEIRGTQESGGKIVAVGTTSVRTLESASRDSPLAEWEGATELFIRPGFSFQVVDQLLTNFHLPGSTLIVLVAALAGYDLTMEAYAKAVEQKYRFYSYGDAMLIL